MQQDRAATEASRHSPVLYGVLAGTIMAYGWGYRGTVGHEAGAMVPGAMLGLVLCVAACRRDWQQRAAVGGLFGAVGFAWGGSLSYMEQTFYVLSDSLPDVLYGYAMLFFLGALWGGLGGGIFGLALTEPRSELEQLARVFTAICAVFLSVHVYFFFAAEQREQLETFTVRHFHDGDWLPALLTALVAGGWWLARPRDRNAAALFFWGAVAWWVGYLALTKFGGLRLGPLHRSESWGGVLGMLLFFAYYLHRRQNRAALLLCLYGILGSGAAFAFAVFLRHPLVLQWGPFAGVRWPQWRFAEDLFGFFMGIALALGAHRLLRGGLAPPREDTPRAPLDVYAVFVLLVALVWVNFRRHAAPWLAQSNALSRDIFLGLPAWPWFVMGGMLATLPVLYVLFRYLRGDRSLAPPTAFGKGAGITLLFVWVTLAGYLFHEPPSAASMLGHLLLWLPAGLASLLLLAFASSAQAPVPAGATVPPHDPQWRVGAGYWALWGAAALMLLLISLISTAMQDGPLEGHGRKRFGPEAYWRQTARLIGAWDAVALVRRPDEPDPLPEPVPQIRLEFDQYRNVAHVTEAGARVDMHRWFLKNQYFWLQWYGKEPGHEAYAEMPLEFRGERVYVAWPPGSAARGYLAFERHGE